MRRLHTLLLATALLAAPLSACDDATAPGEIAGTYTLRTVNDAPLPATVATGFGLSYTVTAGTVTLRDGGTLDGSFTATATGAPAPATFTYAGTWSNDDDRVSITIPDLGSSGHIAATFSGGNTLSFTASLFAGAGEQRVVFRK